MKCKSCSKNYSGLLRTCPFCGTPSSDNVVYPNNVARFLARPREFGSFCVTNMSMLLVFAINLSIAALIVNLFTFAASGLWCQYVICGAFGLYGVMRGFFGSKTSALRTVREAVLFAIIAMAATATAYNFNGKPDAAMQLAEYAIPITVISLGAISLIFLFLGLATPTSFAVTTAIDTLISTVLLVLAVAISGKFTAPICKLRAFAHTLLYNKGKARILITRPA